LFSRRPRFVNTDLRPESIVERKHHTKLLTDGSLREWVGSIVVGDMAQHTCLVHGLEAFNRVSQRLLEFKDYITRSGAPRQNLPRLLRLGHERHRQRPEGQPAKERSPIHYSITASARTNTDSGNLSPSAFAVLSRSKPLAAYRPTPDLRGR